jgi:putative N6-adenine-specific DNA methylase
MQELTDLGCINVAITSPSAVLYTADLRTSLKTLLECRTAHKLLESLDCSDSNVQTRDDISRLVRSINVRDLLGDGRGGLLSVQVQCIMNAAQHIPADINHSHYTCLTIKNALCDAVRDLRGDRPNVDLIDPDVVIVGLVRGIVNQGADVSLYRQCHVGSLHRRGYRSGVAVHKAAMKESLAAGLLLHAGWADMCMDKSKDSITMIDPMAGSGTLVLEAAMIAAKMAPGLMRIKCGVPGANLPCALRWKYPGESEPQVAVQLWKELLTEATKTAKLGIQTLQQSRRIQLIGNDMHEGALDLFEHALTLSGLASIVQVTEGNIKEFDPSIIKNDKWFLVSNPPWGERLDDDMHASWESLRVFLRESCPGGTEAWLLSGNPAATKHLGLRRSQSLPVKTGDQDLRWLQYLILDKSSRPENAASAIGRRKSHIEGADKPVKRPLARRMRQDTVAKSRPRNSQSRAKGSTAKNEWII